MKMLKTIRLDASDTFIFPQTAENEIAVIGTFLFWDKEMATLTNKEKQAFRAGFVGIKSTGFSTLVEVVDENFDDALEILTTTLFEIFDAPTLLEARLAANEELKAASAIANHPIGTLIAMHRTYEEGAFKEIFRTLTLKQGGSPADNLHANANAFTFHEVEEEVDLMGLMEKKLYNAP
jgi:hypothetical protein